MELSDIVVVLAHMVVFIVFANRYFVGLFFRKLRWRSMDMADDTFEPTVSVVVPMYNEGKDIYRNINRLAELEYPHEKLEIVVVDDCSTDDSHEWARKAAALHDNVRVLRNPVNVGKRRGINRAVRDSDSEIIVSVDSDVMVAPDAVKQLVRRFVRPEIVAVGGRVNILNKDETWLTRMQTVKYFFGFEYLKNLECAFSTVMCLSGCLTAYRREVLIELEEILENRNVCGIPIKYGEDRFLTRQIIKAGHQTTMTLDANCYTIAPPTLTKYFSQQLRWRRSNLIDYLGGITHIWNVHPAVAVHYLGLFSMMVTYPLIIMHHFMKGNFFELAIIHVGILAIMCCAYQIHALSLPEEKRVSPFDFLAMAFVMPVTYLLLTPLAAFTLDTGSWETRGHQDEGRDRNPAEPEPVRPAVPQPVAALVPLAAAHSNVITVAEARAARTRTAEEYLPVLTTGELPVVQRVAADGGR